MEESGRPLVLLQAEQQRETPIWPWELRKNRGRHDRGRYKCPEVLHALLLPCSEARQLAVIDRYVRRSSSDVARNPPEQIRNSAWLFIIYSTSATRKDDPFNLSIDDQATNSERPVVSQRASYRVRQEHPATRSRISPVEDSDMLMIRRVRGRSVRFFVSSRCCHILLHDYGVQYCCTV